MASKIRNIGNNSCIVTVSSSEEVGVSTYFPKRTDCAAWLGLMCVKKNTTTELEEPSGVC